jgi:26S proteasome regulatory subunit N2
MSAGVAVQPPTAIPTASSAAGLIALLDEPSDELKRYALRRLDSVVDTTWAEISSAIASVEALYEDDMFADRQLAALVASKVRPMRQQACLHLRSPAHITT